LRRKATRKNVNGEKGRQRRRERSFRRRGGATISAPIHPFHDLTLEGGSLQKEKSIGLGRPRARTMPEKGKKMEHYSVCREV